MDVVKEEELPEEEEEEKNNEVIGLLCFISNCEYPNPNPRRSILSGT